MKAPDPKSIKFFKKPEDLGKWLSKYGSQKDELYVGYYKKATKLQSITWPESVDEALCHGWIDGIRRSLGEKSYCIRFTPRREGSHWSAVNVKRMEALQKEGRVQDTGLAAYKKLKASRTASASYEQKNVALNTKYEKQLKANKKAWTYFSHKAPSYRKQCIWWVMSAKQEKTRLRRLGILIESSAEEKVIPPFKWAVKKKAK